MCSNIHIFTGHFGSGKTEVALNFAERSVQKNKTAVVDMDIVNPYFRTAEHKEMLKKQGIEVICSDFAASNVDIPILVPEVTKVFYDRELICIFDVGGDEDGAYALGVYKRFFENQDYKLHFVVNTRRPLTQNAEDILEMMCKIEDASRLKITDIVNNTNIGEETDYNILMSGRDILDEVCRKKNIGIYFHSGMKGICGDENFFGLDIHIKKPWNVIL